MKVHFSQFGEIAKDLNLCFIFKEIMIQKLYHILIMKVTWQDQVFSIWTQDYLAEWITLWFKKLNKTLICTISMNGQYSKAFSTIILKYMNFMILMEKVLILITLVEEPNSLLLLRPKIILFMLYSSTLNILCMTITKILINHLIL